MSRPQLLVIVGAILLVGLVIVVTLIGIDANNRREACEDKYGMRAPLFCEAVVPWFHG